MRDTSLLGPWIRRFMMEHMVSERNLARNTQLALEYCLAHPQWKLSLQTHKFVGIR